MPRRVTVQLIDSQYDPVPGLRVVLVQTAERLQTNAEGEVTFTHVPDVATFEVFRGETRVAGHVAAQPLADGTTLVLRVGPQAVARLFLDADRDGTLTSEGLDRWDWGVGPGKKGAIILCNLDADGAIPQRADNSDEVINGGDDALDIAPLEVRRDGAHRPDATCTLSLENPRDIQRIRIFDGISAGARALIGPRNGHTCRLDLSRPVLRLGMEALRFDLTPDEHDIVLVLTTSAPEGTVVQRARVRVAPWMMQHHLEPPQTVYVVAGTTPRFDNTAFRSTLKAIVETRLGLSLVELPCIDGDRWGQDSLEFGSSNLPTHGLHAILGASRRVGLINHFAQRGRGPGVGFFGFAAEAESDMNKLGNLEVTPPVMDHKGRNFPFGRIYYGDGAGARRRLDPNVQAFLKAQRVQAPIVIDTGWLDVGHVDEILSFVPAEDGGWKLCLPSPLLALTLLEGVLKAEPNAVLLEGRSVQGVEGEGFEEPIQTTVAAFFKDGMGGGGARRPTGMPNMMMPPRREPMPVQRRPHPGLGSLSSVRRPGAMPSSVSFEGMGGGFPRGISEVPTLASVIAFNKRADEQLQKLVDQLKRDIGLRDEQILRIPVLYRQGKMKGLATLTANMVNMLVLERHCIMAKPFGPMLHANKVQSGPYGQLLVPHGIDRVLDVPAHGTFDLFEVYVKSLFRKHGLTAHTLDNWRAYHDKGGEVHCATNTRRGLTLKRWWEFAPEDALGLLPPLHTLRPSSLPLVRQLL
ncbi:hypothetical protein D7X74_37315 [Corallococcus sp. CA047B]|uniref:protein-arginine deiminase family protein n=1 Tax=Corallococcus sp. CA047B TaxID=2316729 RepID=UPI000EA0D80F|nr:protein-arginine deiminase family protein [Corallococcus sp. CA047B]RKH02266.1 hypothetical protein D7X74_37315 [Corallococcus sp. CA047B]